MTCIPRNGIKEMMGINNSISDTHKIVVNPPKGRVRNGMRIVQRSWDTYNRGFMPVLCRNGVRTRPAMSTAGIHNARKCQMTANTRCQASIIQQDTRDVFSVNTVTI